MSNNDLFLDLYNKLDSLLRTYYNDENLDNSMINRRINELKRSNRNEKKLRGIKLNDARNVRNLLAHTMKNNGNDLFDVNNDLIEFLESEIKSITSNKKAYEIMTPYDELYFCELSSDIKETLINMRRLGHSTIPVLKDRKVIGIFNNDVIINALIDSNFKVSLSMLKLNISLDSISAYYYEFISKNEVLDNIEEMFEIKKDNKKLSLIFVTENGNENERLLGIITLYDVLKNN